MPTLEEIKKRKQYITYANQTEEKYGLPKNLLVGVMGAESNFNPNAVSHVGAKGLMQFMKATAQEYGINPLNPSESINAAGKYLQSSYKKFGNWEDALRSYNMGVGGLQKVKAGKKSLPKETKDYVGRVYKYAGIKYEDPSYVNTSPQDNNQVQETITPTLNYFNIPKEITTFASVPDSAKEDKKETVEDGVTSKDVAEVEQKTKEYNFLEELQKEDYSHLQPEQVAQQQIVPQVDFNQQYEQVSQFIDEPLVAQQGLTWQEKLANRPKKPTVAEIIAEGDARKAQQRAQTDNIPNTKRDLSLMLAEHNNIKKDEQELRTTGQIKNPNSIQYRRNVKTQPDIKQDDISTEQRNAQLNPLERPLIYLANPSKLLGDIGIPNMETSELDRQAISSNRFNPNQTRTQRLENQVKLGLGYVPEATVNTALAASFMPEGSGALGLVNEALNPLAGTGDLINNLGNKYLPNAYKLNPNAFKPNPEAYYRVIGEAGYKDAIENNIIRPKINSIHSINYPTFKKGVPLDNRYASSEIKGLIGDNSYIVESNGNKMVQNNWTAAAPDKDIFLPRRELKAENEGINFYKKDWLQGYKQVEVPKTTQNFNSEINWANWNKEIPDNPQLIQEYNAIEQTSKSNGSWMKNPDGSKFQGTPEQFVQQNSENFKKAFSGKVNKQYHTTDKNFEVFDTTKSPSKGIFFTPDKEYSEKFTKIYKPSDEVSNTGEYYLNVNKPLNVDDPISHTTVSHYYNQRPFAAGKYDAIQGKEMDILGGKSDINVTTVFSPNQIKSAIGNSGMFDINNPNIYKSVAPIAGASYLATQGQNKQQGGKQNYTENELAFLSEIQGIPVSSRGMYDYPNQEVIVPTNGSITMKGIPHKIKAKSLETGEEKILKPNREYYFKNTKNVLEIPFFKK